MIKKITLAVITLVVAYLGRQFFVEYFALHPYYEQFVSGDTGKQTLQILLLGITCALIPVSYLSVSKKKSFWMLFLLLWLGLWLFQTSYVGIKAELLGGAVIKTLINTGFILGLGTLFCSILIALGVFISDRVLKIEVDTTIMKFLLAFGLGLIVFLSLEYIVLLLNIAFPLVNRLLLLGGTYAVRCSRDTLHDLRYDLQQELWSKESLFFHRIATLIFGIVLLPFVFSLFSVGSTSRAWVILLIAGGLIGNWVYAVSKDGKLGLEEIFTIQGVLQIASFLLLLVSVWYFYNGFVLSYIPYPTAWDANHAYMFLPKMFALNNGYYWSEPSMRGFGGIWLSYITYRFSLFSRSDGFLGISADTIAIEMNFLSGIFVLIFGIGLVHTLLSYLSLTMKDKGNTQLLHGLTLFGWFLLLLRNTSGMGAFLVFIDNKTDMGVLAMVILALLNGFFFLRYLASTSDDQLSTKKLYTWLGLSASFFVFAALAKPTAMFDILNFGLLLRGQRFGVLGIIGIIGLVLGVLAIIKIMGVGDYISPTIGRALLGLGALGLSIDVMVSGYKKIFQYGKYILLWTAVVVVLMVGLKSLYYIPDALFYGSDKGIKERIQALLLANKTEHNQENKTVLLTQNTGNLPSNTCSLQSEGLSNKDGLYTELKELVGDGYNEDIRRYIGYGWKGGNTDAQRGIPPFQSAWWNAWLDEGCTGFSPFFLDTTDAVALCEREQDRKSFDPKRLASVKEHLKSNGKAYEVVTKLENAEQSSLDEMKIRHAQDIQVLEGIMQGESIRVVTTNDGVRSVYVPYKYLNFFNISFNRSLQNLSSYYTDIGIVWLLFIIMAVFGLIYAVIKQERFLIILHVVTLFGWILWLIVGGGILWYAIGIIVWTILCVIALLYSLLRGEKSALDYTLCLLFLLVLLTIGAKQLELNMTRISTQGGGGPFMRYKTNNGIVQDITFGPQGQIIPQNTLSGKFNANDVFGMQFPHYTKFLHLVNEREKEEGALIAGTYARYFINNQNHIISDQFLTEFWKQSSDNNVCRTNLRLKDKGIKYLAIDPNIGTVVQGDGNKSLFERFFGRLNPVTQVIEQHGTFTMLSALFRAGHLRYVSSNNLGAKYAFLLPDSVFGTLSDEQITVTRAKMAIARFFPQEQQLVSSILSIADQRVKDGSFVDDIADVMGLQVSDSFVQDVMGGKQLDPQTLTLDEKKVVAQFFQIRQLAASNPAEYQKALQNIVVNSLGAGNQIIVLEMVE